MIHQTITKEDHQDKSQRTLHSIGKRESISRKQKNTLILGADEGHDEDNGVMFMVLNGVITLGRMAGEVSEKERRNKGKEVAEQQIQWF